MESKYILYGGELSYFTRKLEAALHFYGLDFEMREKSRSDAAMIESRSGTHQIPVLETPENWMISDTTPIIQFLDARFPATCMFPKGLNGILVHILEEFFDEWVARTMVHYRWHYEESATFASLRMANGNEAIAERVKSWGPRACRATGTDSRLQQKAAEAEYLRVLEAMETQLGETPYMLGTRPTALDCVLLGGLRAHTNMDPDPKKVTAKFPKVLAWCDDTADRWDGSGQVQPFTEPTKFARFVLGEMGTTYQPYIMANRDAQLAGAKAFHVSIYDEDVSYLSRSYPEASRQMILQRIQHNLNDAERREIFAWLSEQNLDGCFSD